MSRFHPLLALAALAVMASMAGGQDPGRPPLNREQMWPAPTAADWAKPCLITWQRTWEDAQARAKETEQAILICVNMDGEIASEHYAGVRYRQEEIAKLYEPYVTVIASTYRHTPRDYDEEGRRILCPRFGSVTCGEHISIEPIIYEKYLDGQRVAPRHIMIELDGSETYDVFYRNDVASVFDDIRKGITERKTEPKNVVRGDRSMTERVASPDIRDRVAVESAYREGDEALRRTLLQAAGKQEGAVPLDLLRLALNGLDVDLAKMARSALAGSESPGATDLIVDSLRIPMADQERKALIAALARLGKSSPKARWVAVVEEGLTVRKAAIDVGAWAKGGAKYQPPPTARALSDLETMRETWSKVTKESPEDAAACIELAEASLALAMKARHIDTSDTRTARLVARHMFEDARIAALKAEKLEAAPWRVNTVVALSAYYRGDLETAYRRAETAVKALPPGEPSWNTMAVLTVFAEGRFKAIKKAARAQGRWPPQWLADLDAAYSALLHHPLATDTQILWHHEFLIWLGAKRRASRFLGACLVRFPDSPTVHERIRTGILEEKGVDELEKFYDAMLKAEDSPRNTRWFAAYAVLISAEFHRRAGKAGKARATYGRAIGHYERVLDIHADWQESVDHYVALALAGRARLAYEAGDDGAALTDLLACFERSPGSAGSKDGMGITPAATAQMLLSRLKDDNKADLASKLAEALAKLDPALLVPEEE